MDFVKHLSVSLNVLSRTPQAPICPGPELELEAGPCPLNEVPKTLLERGLGLIQGTQNCLENAFLGRTQPLVAVPTALHTASLVAREAIPAFVASPVVGSVGAVVKLASSFGAPYVAKLSHGWSAELTSNADLSPVYQALNAVLPRTAGLGLTLAALASFPAAEAAALSVDAVGQAAQTIVRRRGASRWKRSALAAACQVAVLLAREGVYSASTKMHYTVAASPYDLSSTACNGARENCAAQWCDVVFPATHNSMMQPAPFRQMRWPINEFGRFASNQARSLESQFADGIRGFLVEFYQNEQGELRTSHNTVFDREPLQQTLQRFATLLAAHPRDLIALQLSQQQRGNYHDKLVDLFKASGLSNKTIQNTCHVQSNSALDTPSCRLSMGSLLDSGVQAVVITLPLQTKYDASTLAGLNCEVAGYVWPSCNALHRNSTYCEDYDNRLADIWSQVDFSGAKIAPVTWNAFVSLALPSASAVVNSYLPNFVAKCALEGLTDVSTPTLLAVNHYESSDVVALAHALNTQSFKRPGDAVSCGVKISIS